MGVEINPSEVRSRLAEENKNYRQMIEDTYELINQIYQFIETDSLKSEAYDSTKNYFSTMHITILKSMILFADEKQRENHNYLNILNNYFPGDNIIQEDKILDQLRRTSYLKRMIQNNMLVGYIQVLESTERLLNERLEKIYEYIERTKNIYNESERFLDEIEQGIRCMNTVSPDMETGGFNIPPVNMEWATRLNELENSKYSLVRITEMLEAMAENKNCGKGGLTISPEGIAMITNLEISVEVLKEWGLGEFDENGELIGIYPHYVFKKDDNGNYISDGGITFGYGHWISTNEYNINSSAKELVDTYTSGAPLIPIYIPEDGKSYKVPNSSYISIIKANDLLEEDVKSATTAVNDFLIKNSIELNQNQFDVLVSFTHQYGEDWWTRTPEKVLPKFIREGNGVYDSEEVKKIFLMHDDEERRAIEAEVFINGYK